MLPTPTLMFTTTMVSDIMVLDTTEERRGRLKLNPRLMLIQRLTPGCYMEAMDTLMDTTMPPTPMLHTTTLSPISMVDAGTTRELLSHALEDKPKIEQELKMLTNQ